MVSDAPCIAIIEDDESFQLALVELLGSAGHVAKGFLSAEAFLADNLALFDCVVTDINLPGMSGLELGQKLMSQAPGLPVIMITAVLEFEYRALAAAAGAVCLLQKPFDADELIDCLNKALGRKQG